MWNLYGDDLAREEMSERARRWEPYRSYASLYLWHAEDGDRDGDGDRADGDRDGDGDRADGDRDGDGDRNG